MTLSARQRRALEAICDTFCPDANGMPSAGELGVADAIVDSVAANPRAAERRQFTQLLGLWDSAPLTAAAGGGFHRFSKLDREQREQVLLSWCDSRLPQRRAAFQSLRKGALLMYYMLHGPDGGRNRALDSIEYPGPLGQLEGSPPKRIAPVEITGDTEIDCDVCIVGSGAGGGTAAGVLAAAGLEVVVLEAGDFYDDADFDGDELAGYQRLYMQGGGSASHDQSVGLLAGWCLGGGTVVNYTTSFRTPDDVREEWARMGVPAFATEQYSGALDAVCERLGVNQEHNRPSMREQLLQRGLSALGWHSDLMPRNVRGCDQGENCGRCGFGCRLGAKQSMVKTWLDDAHNAGARIIVRTYAEEVVVRSGVARGVVARTLDGHRVAVRARAVVAACGALQTPALLRRSGLSNINIGKHLKLHPATAVWGVFDEEVRPWEGTMQAVYSDEHRFLDGGYGVKYETASVPPSLLIGFAPWRSASQHAELMQALSHTVPIGVLLRDRDGGEVRVGRDGHPVVHYALSDYDLGHVRAGVDGAARIFEAAGARRIFSSHTRLVAYEPDARGSREQFVRDADACGWAAGRCAFNSFHIMGSARMGGSPETSVCNPRGETWNVRDLYVCDGSAFPTASGVNPQISIGAIAHMVASGLASRLR
ncbi:MAG TPA: GMC family oxidoreductase N-terminal domain-containing protein [Solirubrobacteraceae bacterium]|nr:GMC family oxidoreductase N-terminal domain-containing protein [Solirubrobacteraceae bacterium]